jgi:hypothetical protein
MAWLGNIVMSLVCAFFLAVVALKGADYVRHAAAATTSAQPGGCAKSEGATDQPQQ